MTVLPSSGGGRLGKKQQRKCLAIPVFEPRAAPAAIDDQQPVGLWASDRVQDVGSRFEIQTLPQAGGSDDDLQPRSNFSTKRPS